MVSAVKDSENKVNATQSVSSKNYIDKLMGGNSR